MSDDSRYNHQSEGQTLSPNPADENAHHGMTAQDIREGPPLGSGVPGDSSGPDLWSNSSGPLRDPNAGRTVNDQRSAAPGTMGNPGVGQAGGPGGASNADDYHPERAYMDSGGGLGGGNAMGTPVQRTTAGWAGGSTRAESDPGGGGTTNRTNIGVGTTGNRGAPLGPTDKELMVNGNHAGPGMANIDSGPSHTGPGNPATATNNSNEIINGGNQPPVGTDAGFFNSPVNAANAGSLDSDLNRAPGNTPLSAGTGANPPNTPGAPGPGTPGRVGQDLGRGAIPTVGEDASNTGIHYHDEPGGTGPTTPEQHNVNLGSEQSAQNG